MRPTNFFFILFTIFASSAAYSAIPFFGTLYGLHMMVYGQHQDIDLSNFDIQHENSEQVVQIPTQESLEANSDKNIRELKMKPLRFFLTPSYDINKVVKANRDPKTKIYNLTALEKRLSELANKTKTKLGKFLDMGVLTRHEYDQILRIDSNWMATNEIVARMNFAEAYIDYFKLEGYSTVRGVFYPFQRLAGRGINPQTDRVLNLLKKYNGLDIKHDLDSLERLKAELKALISNLDLNRPIDHDAMFAFLKNQASIWETLSKTEYKVNQIFSNLP